MVQTMRDNRKFLVAIILTLALSGAAVWQSHRRETAGAHGGEPVDVPRFERLMGSGLLTNHPADYSEPLEEGR